MRYRITLSALAALIAALAIAACGSSSSSTSSSSTTAATAGVIAKNTANASKPTIKIGSKNFTEEFILGQIYAQALQAAGYNVKKQLNLGSEQIAYKAVKGGQVDAYPEYTGTALTSFFKVQSKDVPKDAQAAYQETRQKLAANNLTALPPTPFTDSNGFAVTKATAAKLGNITNLSQLAGKTKNLTISGPPECAQRDDCLLGLEKVYGLKFKKFTPIDIALREEVLTKGQSDVGLVFTTDGAIKKNNLVLLNDDKKLFPPYNVTLIARNPAVSKAGPDFQKTIALVNKGLTTPVMQELNARVDLDKQSPAAVAAQYLKESGYIR
ncbi:MAG TPA: glycine betaine ABC transporter substrate-binding protein [Solirubrobacteraceae bacterium]